ncbi:MAG: septum formation initiator family protein [Bacteroidota bacterium]
MCKRISMGEKQTSVFIRVIKNKYFIASFIFVLWILFFDEYSLIAHKKNVSQLKNLIEQQNYYKEKIKADEQKLIELNSGNAELEKYAREQFYMSKPDEDLYIVTKE